MSCAFSAARLLRAWALILHQYEACPACAGSIYLDDVSRCSLELAVGPVVRMRVLDESESVVANSWVGGCLLVAAVGCWLLVANVRRLRGSTLMGPWSLDVTGTLFRSGS